MSFKAPVDGSTRILEFLISKPGSPDDEDMLVVAKQLLQERPQLKAPPEGAFYLDEPIRTAFVIMRELHFREIADLIIVTDILVRLVKNGYRVVMRAKAHRNRRLLVEADLAAEVLAKEMWALTEDLLPPEVGKQTDEEETGEESTGAGAVFPPALPPPAFADGLPHDGPSLEALRIGLSERYASVAADYWREQGRKILDARRR